MKYKQSTHLVLLFLGLFLLLGALIPQTQAWDELDYELFDLVDAVKKSEGKEDASFYSLLGVESTATTNQIAKGFRKMSRTVHPDKNPDPSSQERYSLLGNVASILRNDTARERYNFYYKNGVPSWRGTGYFYRRHRPGFGSVVFALTIFLSLVQYGTSWLTYYLRKRDIQYLIDERAMLAKRQVKRSKKSPVENPATFEDEELDPEMVPKPSVWNVFIFSVPRFFFRKITTKSTPVREEVTEVKQRDVPVTPDSPQGKTRKRGRKSRA
ncbi:DnaJ-domain-containing protein [Basidiobolus meristosporus CBS 931.73]|uniref:DnaJ-domain-containing protein n=1 Tax=Basidiobolus meristosporus CBS 931.73 TaxID=1314790 RepID=A0A1Y1YWX9_9FUNG|nr:DnaJ-domain-containing protein [Basidiobolus meristosporus CBS 931.73]|eukprot:ORY02436.1 DnaJ-domain-containing protein [Basidiobolus meristosporus CBS 931.73]